jgi:hypothetical protein
VSDVRPSVYQLLIVRYTSQTFVSVLLRTAATSVSRKILFVVRDVRHETYFIVFFLLYVPTALCMSLQYLISY